LFLAACALTGLALESAYRLGTWRHARAPEEKETSVGEMVGSILALLAFLLAFTFGLAASRWESRREAVLEEANAIGTTYLRSRLLPEPQRTDAARLLRDYVNTRLLDIRQGSASEIITNVIARSEELQEQLWSKGRSRPEEPHAHHRALYPVAERNHRYARQAHDGWNARAHSDEHLGGTL
jgi:hypothetical protein